MNLSVLSELENVGAILTGAHFVYTSGRHGPNYINLDPLFPNAQLTLSICRLLVEPFCGEFDTVASPAVGGVVLSELSAIAASESGRPIFAVWADKTESGFAFNRAGFERHIRGRRVLLVEDLLTTGGSLGRVYREAIGLGAQVVGASVICNRGGISALKVGVKRLESLIQVDFGSYTAGECPLCRDGVPIVEDIGHGLEYRAHMPDYPGGYVRLVPLAIE